MVARRRPWQLAAIQMTSTTDVDRNVRSAERLICRAAEDGARLVALPENFAYLRSEGSKLTFSTTLRGDLVREMSALAARLKIYLLLGSISERATGGKIYNSSILLGPDGGLLATYRKMHLFDIDIRGGVTLLESRYVTPGKKPTLVETPLGCFGLSICYDLRFPELYRRLALDGAELLFVPAAFTAYTGPHHWLPLLRARAIENQCFVVAPAQTGRHSADRASHGETVIIDPWGTVLARKKRGVGVVSAEIRPADLTRIRRGLPCLEHTRPSLIRGRK